jgi:hypothetical protein
MEYSKMTVKQIREYFGDSTYDSIKIIMLLHFKNADEAVRKSVFAKRMFDKYKTFKSETVVSVINTYIEMGIVTDLGDGTIRISNFDDYKMRDEKILNNVGQN